MNANNSISSKHQFTGDIFLTTTFKLSDSFTSLLLESEK